MCKHGCKVALHPPPKVGGFTAMEDKTPFEAMQATHNGDINSMQDNFFTITKRGRIRTFSNIFQYNSPFDAQTLADWLDAQKTVDGQYTALMANLDIKTL